MLIKFSARNYHSFKEMEIYSSPGRSRKKNEHILGDESLKVSAIYGANASGKSNIITAIKSMKNIITMDYCTFKYPLHNWSSDSKITDFEIHFKNGSIYYRYRIEVESICCKGKNNQELFMPMVLHERLDRAYDVNPMTGEENWSNVIDTSNRNINIDSLRDILEKTGTILLECSDIKSKLLAKEPSLGELIKERELIAPDYYEAKTLDLPVLKEIEKKWRDTNNKIEKISELEKSLADHYFSLNELKSAYNRTRPLLSTMTYSKDSTCLEKQEYMTICSEVLGWFTGSLMILETADFLLPIGHDRSMNGLSTVIQSLDVGITGIEWKQIEDDRIINEAKASLSESEYLKLNNCRGISIRDSTYVATTVKQNSNFYLFSYWLGDENVYRLAIKHGLDRRSLDTSYESDGTLRIIELAAILLPTDRDRIYIIDELDRRLHPNLTKFIVSSFIDDESKNKQLIFTTHETNLMTTNLFRLDEIWVVDKDDEGVSQIKSLDECGIKHDELLVEQYLSKKFGGVPSITDERHD